MARWEKAATGPARWNAGLPILQDGSAERPLLLRLPDAERGSACNNGCAGCLTQPLRGDDARFDADVRGRHVILRDREALLRRDLPALVRALRERGAAHVSVVTNGRLLLYPQLVQTLLRAGLSRFIVKLFALDAAEHDAHTRTPGSYEQALGGLRAATAGGASVVITFPRPILGPPAEQVRQRQARAAHARELTGFDPVEMPEPQVESHGGGYVYDVMDLQAPFVAPQWGDSWFPMVHVNTGPACNIRCVYCNVHGGDDQRLFDRPYVERVLDSAAARILSIPRIAGIPTVDFVGGEPTLHPELPALVAHARRVGFPQVTVCTNGVLLRRRGYLDSLVQAGLTGLRVSLHEHRAHEAGALADVGGVGDTYPEVAEMLLARDDLEVQIYRIILGSTLSSLVDYVRWLVAHKTSQRRMRLVFGMPSMRGRMLDDPSLLPPLESLRESVAEASALATPAGFDVLVFHAPACLIPDHPERAACLHINNAQLGAMDGSSTPASSEGHTYYGEACGRCDGRALGCDGLPEAYFHQDRAAAEAWLRPLRYTPAVRTSRDG